MSDKKMLTPAEVAEYTLNAGIKKATTPTKKVLVSAFLAGMYIALGALGSLAASYNLLANPATYGLGKMVAGLMFPAGLVLILIAGGDLFTSNILITLAALKKKVTWGQTAKNWSLVWFGNLLGAAFAAALVAKSGVFDWSHGLYGGVVVKTAVGKANIGFVAAIASGIVCNLLVCATVWSTYAAKSVSGKVIMGWLGIFVFVCIGVEHVVANMGYLLSGLMVKLNPMYLEAAHKTLADVASLNIGNVFLHNFLPVTIGNILGGMIIAGSYYFLFMKEDSK
ncbi:formate/nitrite transporter family protein [Paraclostridium bifermentans]|uniref:formate/nitrite transporter family protein n=1 Tax=Paraclostridium bifermentans TaxID=1490 RepID=UPI00359C7026